MYWGLLLRPRPSTLYFSLIYGHTINVEISNIVLINLSLLSEINLILLNIFYTTTTAFGILPSL